MLRKLITIVLSCAVVASLLAGCSSAPAAEETAPEAETTEQATNNAESEAGSEAENVTALSGKTFDMSGPYTTIVLNTTEKEDGSFSHEATIDGESIPECDYTWHCDPAGTYDEKDDAPAEYYTGSKPEGEKVYIAHDIYYYPQIDESKFEKVNYDGEMEWVTYYQSDEYKDYIFGTLPIKGQNVPSEMMHTAADAYDNAVLHIETAGTYKLSGDWHGQIYIDLGDDANEDPDAVVNLILENANIDCSVAPGVIFKQVYECDNEWEDRDEYSAIVDTSAAGANIVIADDSANTINGTNIFRMLKTKYKDDDSKDAVPVQKKIRKNDGALYSYMSMNICGGPDSSGTLNVISGNEGIDSELHLTIESGIINIYAQDDGINTNEDDVSVTTINGGDIRIIGGLGSEGDGIDSNGYLVINGGKVISLASPMADSGLDSSCGSYINGGEVLALGSTMDWAENDDSNDSGAVTMNLRFGSTQTSDEKIEILDEDGQLIFTYCQADDPRVSKYQKYFTGAIISCPGLKVGNTYNVWVGGRQQAYTSTDVGGFGGGTPPQFKDGERPEMPEGMTPPEGFEGKEPPEGFDGKERPEGFDGKEPPEGFDGKEPPEGFDGKEPTEGFKDKQPQNDFDGKMPPNMGGSEQEFEPIADFTMQDKVNNFGGVQDL